MTDGFAYLDLLFFAMIAAFVIFRLGSVLGRRTGHERRRQSPVDVGASEKVVPLRRPEGEPVRVDAGDGGLKMGLAQIRLKDPQFDLDHFLEGAKAAFEMILVAYAKGDKDSLQMLLAPEVFARFGEEMDRRAASGHSLMIEVVAIRQAEVVEASLRGYRARITVRFVSEQITATRDATGRLIAGNPSQIVEVEDLWTFERDVRSADPNWLLVETRAPE